MTAIVGNRTFNFSMSFERKLKLLLNLCRLIVFLNNLFQVNLVDAIGTVICRGTFKRKRNISINMQYYWP